MASKNGMLAEVAIQESATRESLFILTGNNATAGSGTFVPHGIIPTQSHDEIAGAIMDGMHGSGIVRRIKG